MDVKYVEKLLQLLLFRIIRDTILGFSNSRVVDHQVESYRGLLVREFNGRYL